MKYPLIPDEKGIKIIANEMEIEKMYYCYHNRKIMLVYKDEQQFLNCYELEDKEIVDMVKDCKKPEEIEKLVEEFITKTKKNLASNN